MTQGTAMQAVLAAAPGGRLLTYEEVARVCAVSRKTVQEWKRLGLLAGFEYGDQVVRFEPAEVYRFIRAHTRGRRAQGGVSEPGTPGGSEWDRIERLIRAEVEAVMTDGKWQMAKEAA